jgi:hypothetical protein
MQNESINPSPDSGAKSKGGAGFLGGTKRTIDAKCEGCDRIKLSEDKKFCAAYPDPTVRWRLGNCNLATHIKVETKAEASKVRVGQQKQKKK